MTFSQPGGWLVRLGSAFSKVAGIWKWVAVRGDGGRTSIVFGVKVGMHGECEDGREED